MYCVYLTIYKGSKLPRRYIGSSTVKRILSGKYFGSVKSKKYKKIFEYELKENPDLFKIRILSKFNTHEEAIQEELRLHKKYDVIKNPLFINLSYATVNGFFGRDITGINHPFYGKKHTKKTKMKISENLKGKFKDGTLISPFALMSHAGENNGFYGKKHSEKSKLQMSKPKKQVPKWKCPHCNKFYDAGNIKQHLKRQKWKDEDIEMFKYQYAFENIKYLIENNILIKPEGWTGPSHDGNYGLLVKLND